MKTMTAMLYYFFPGLLTGILIKKSYPKTVLDMVNLLIVSCPYNLIITASSYLVNKVLWGSQALEFEFDDIIYSYSKLAYGLTAIGIAVGLAAVILFIRSKVSSAFILLGSICFVFLLGTPLVLTQYQMEMTKRVKINEICSDNFCVLADAGGYYADYIELYNPAYVEVELKNLFLSDSKKQLDKFALQDKIIPARGYCIVYASGDHIYEDMTEEAKSKWEQEIHAPFKISANGEEIFLSTADGMIIDRVKVPELTYNKTYARVEDGNTEFHITTATPAKNNATVIEPYSYEVISQELPRIYIEGNLDCITKDVNAHALVKYVDKEQEYDWFAKLQLQGGWTAHLSEKNSYNIKLYSDVDMNCEERICLKEAWGEQHRYCLKSNILDKSQAKNIVTSRIWNDMVVCRENVDEHLLKSPNGGATDGFPILVYVNGLYKGVYTLNIPKNIWMFSMGEGAKEAIWFTRTHAHSAGFGETIDFDTQLGIDWDLKYCSTEDDTWAKESINQLINFVITHEGQDFREGIEEYLDVNAAIDYLILLYLSGAGDNMEKNICWLTYDGKVWMPSMYDLDYTWEFYSTPLIPQFVNGKVESNAGMLLWQRIVDNYPTELANRYFELRDRFLTPEYVQQQFENFMKEIPQNVYELEYATREEEEPANVSEELEEIMNYVWERFDIFDEFYTTLLKCKSQ